MCTGSIPPLIDPQGMIPPMCPDGYFYDPVNNVCCPNATPPIVASSTTYASALSGMSAAEFDPAQAAKVAMQGVKDSGGFETLIAGILRMAVRFLKVLIIEAASLLDDVLATLADVFQAAQGQTSSGYYDLAAKLVTDLLGVETSGAALFAAFTQGGRQAAMTKLGGDIFDVLAAEFANVAQSGSGGSFTIPQSTGQFGLPDVQLSPAQGVAGGKAFLGYASSFAIREGNTDMLAAYLPHGIGEMFKDFAEDFSKNLGIGRIGRLVWKPLVTTMVGTPMQQALNIAYRPKLLDAGEAVRAQITGDLDNAGLAAELNLQGLSDARQQAIYWQHAKALDFGQIRTLAATGAFADADTQTWLARIGHNTVVGPLLMQAADIQPAREECLVAARHFAQQYLTGKITRVQMEGAIKSVVTGVNGTTFLTAGEVAGFMALPEIASAAPRKHLSLFQLQRDYIDGLITLQEFSDAALALGYSTDDVQILEQELLIAAKRASDKAAKAAAALSRGKLAKLTVAQMKTAFETGLLDQAEIEAELSARGYTQQAIDTLITEFRVAAKLQPPGTPQP